MNSSRNLQEKGSEPEVVHNAIPVVHMVGIPGLRTAGSGILIGIPAEQVLCTTGEDSHPRSLFYKTEEDLHIDSEDNGSYPFPGAVL
jgi:hypothetical protein